MTGALTIKALYAAAQALGIATAGISFFDLVKKVQQKINVYTKTAILENIDDKRTTDEKQAENSMKTDEQQAENSMETDKQQAENSMKTDEQQAENSMETVNKPLYTPNGQQNFDKDTGLSIPSIEDKTNENVEKAIPLSSTEEWLKIIQDAQKAQWERNDAKQAHIEEREDNAYQRAVADMRKAGINPNLMNITPAESGGGFTAAEGLDFSPVTTQMNNEIKEILDEIDKSFKGGQNEKDRIKELIKSLGQMAMMYFAMRGKGIKGG